MIDFQDDDFLANREWVQKFLAAYTPQIAVPFICLASPLHIRDEDYLRRLRQAGLVSICVGIQSGSKRTQKIFQRSFDRASTVRIAEMSNRLGILAQFDVILNNPFETEEDVTETLNLLLDLRRPFRLNLFSLTFFPNYKITRTAIERGLIKDAEIGYTKLENEKGDYAQDSHLNNLIYLTQVGFFPKALIRWMAKSPWLKRHPQVTKFWVRLTQHTLGGRLTYLVLLVLRNPRTILATLLRRRQSHTRAKV